MNDELIINGKIFNTMVAVTSEEQATGLMWKKWPPPIMLFPFKRAEYRKFWMKNTISPLDIIFCNSNKIIDIYHGEPLSLIGVGPNQPSDLVIEMPRGYAEEHGLHIGDEINVRYSAETALRRYKTG